MGATLIQNRLQTLFGQREHNRDRLKLSDYNDATGVSRVYDIANVDEANSGAPINRRLDLGVIELRLGVVDRRLIRLYGCLKLIDCELRGIKSCWSRTFRASNSVLRFNTTCAFPNCASSCAFLATAWSIAA